MAQVIGLSANPTTLIEDEGTLTTLTINLSEPPPAGGLIVTLTSDMINSLGEFDVFAAQFNGAQITGVSDNTDGFTLRITSQTATISLPVFPDSETEGNETITFSLQSGEGFTIDPAAAAVAVTIQDTATPAPSPSPSPSPTPPPPPSSGLPLVSLNTGPDFLVESEGTVSAHVFNITGGTIPAGGLVVSVSAPNLSEFDLSKIKVSEGGEIIAVRSDGFDIRLTDFTVLVDLPIANDGETEGLETASFTLQAGDGYEVNSALSNGEFTLVDTAEEVPTNALNKLNDTISRATDTELSAANPTYAIKNWIGFEIGNRYQKEDGSFTNVDATEDIDFYKVDLKAGDTIRVDIDSSQFGIRNPLELDSVLRIFDANGTPVAFSDGAPGVGEVFESTWDPYIEFTAETEGSYYVGVSTWENLTYDPLTPGSGSGFTGSVWGSGEYNLEISLNSQAAAQPTVITPGTGEGPTVMLETIAGTFKSDFDTPDFNVIAPALIEGSDFSALTLVLSAEGAIPPGGVEVIINSDVDWTKQFNTNIYYGESSLAYKPTTFGGAVLEAIYDDTGRATGIKYRLDQPYAIITLPVFGDEQAEDPLQANFFLEASEGYTVSADATPAAVTFYDTLEQVPEPSVVPEVSISISDTTLVEAEANFTTVTFTLSEPPPAEGVLIYVNSGVFGAVSELAPFAAEITGGVFPLVDNQSSGFYFKILEQTATLTLPVFADGETEGIEQFTYSVEPGLGYTVNPDASSVSLTLSDTLESQIQVSLSAEPQYLVESEGTVSVHTFSLSTAPPEEGLTVFVAAPDLDQFDLSQVEVTGGSIAEVTNAGFTLTLTEQQATINLPVASDQDLEGSQEAPFTLVANQNYQINPDANTATFTIVDTADQIPPLTEETEVNDTIDTAIATGLGAEQISFSITGAIAHDFNNNPRVDASEDVDFYSVNLQAGDTINVDIDSSEYLLESGFTVPQQLDSELRLFDAEGDELVRVNNSPAPDEASGRDPYLTFTTEAAGTYYIGVSQLGNRTYDPFTAGSGTGWIFIDQGINSGPYELNVSLTAATNPPPTDPPVTSNQTLYGTDASETLTGDDGNDTLYGNGGMDTLTGGKGDDLIYGGSQMDTILGGDGNDTLYANGSGDTIDAGTGMDTVWLGAGKATITLNAGEGYVTVKNFQLGETQFQGAGSGLSFSDSADGVKISKGDDLLAVVTWQTASTFSSNAAMIFV